MHILSKIRGWTQGGHMGNAKQIPWDKLIQVGIQLYSAYQAGQQKKDLQAATDKYSAGMEGIGSEAMEKYNEMISYAEEFMPGGQFYRTARQGAVDTAFHAATKGEESLLAKGIDMSSYGSGQIQEIIKEKYTTDFTSDYKDFASMGTQLLGQSTTLFGEYADTMTTALGTAIGAEGDISGMETSGDIMATYATSEKGRGDIDAIAKWLDEVI